MIEYNSDNFPFIEKNNISSKSQTHRHRANEAIIKIYLEEDYEKNNCKRIGVAIVSFVGSN